jgi:hypothetical protein
MPSWCLPANTVVKFKQAILSGRIHPERLAEMSSAERRAVLQKEVGDFAEQVNIEFETKLLLKNRQQGYISWARKVLGENTPSGRDVISRIQRMDKILSAPDETAFLNDLAAKRLGTDVSFAEAKRIAELSKRIDETRAAMEAGGDRLEYGAALVGLKRYVGDLKGQAERLTREDFKRQPIRSTLRTAWEGVKISKALRAAWDNSSIYRPGNRVMMTSPKIWSQRALKSFKDIWDTYGGKDVVDILDADLLSRENALNGYYKRAKLDIGVLEEAFPTDVPERAMGFVGQKIEQTGVPVLSKVAGRAVGKTYKASQDVYTSFTRGTRADVFDKYIDIAKRTNVELDDVQLQAIGRMVNSLVGRGRLGSLERAGEATNIAFFSPKMLKSHVDVLLEPISGGGGGFTGLKADEPGTVFVRKQASLNLLRIVGGTAAILTIAKAVDDDSVDFDPRSANFGKIKVGNTRLDVTGGMASVAMLASRLATGKTKSSLSGKVREFNERDDEGKIKFGAQTYKDTVYDFFENKLSPPAAVLKDIAEGQTFHGEKPTLTTTLRDLYEPMPASNYRELSKDPNSAPKLLAIIADGLGVATNTYGMTPEQQKRAESDTLKESIDTLKDRRRAGQNVEREIQSLLSKGVITNRQVDNIRDAASETRLQSQIKAMSLDRALTKYATLDAEQQKSVREIIEKKARHVDDLPLREQHDLKQKLTAFGIPF